MKFCRTIPTASGPVTCTRRCVVAGSSNVMYPTMANRPPSPCLLVKLCTLQGFHIEGSTTIQMPGQRWRSVHQDTHADTVLGVVPWAVAAEKLHLLQPSHAYGLWMWRVAVATVSPNLLPPFRDLLVQRCALGFQSPIPASPTPVQSCQHISQKLSTPLSTRQIILIHAKPMRGAPHRLPAPRYNIMKRIIALFTAVLTLSTVLASTVYAQPHPTRGFG